MLGQFPAGLEGLLVGDPDHLVQQGAVQYGGNEVGADALNLVGAGLAEASGSTAATWRAEFCSFR